MVGGILASILPDKVFEATGIHPSTGQLNHPGDLDEDSDLIIDELPLDYSILDEIDYKYPASDAYFAYMTRGCVNHCNLTILSTMNSSDQNVFTLDTAFKRRWSFEQISNDIMSDIKHSYKSYFVPGTNVTWETFLTVLNDEIF